VRNYRSGPTRSDRLAGMPERHPVVASLGEGIEQIDTILGGDTEFNAVYLIRASEPALVEAGPGADTPVVLEALDALGVGSRDLAHLVVTHIHLDHAGGAGALAERFPRATVWVHSVGAPHLVDPARLVASTARTYGEARMLDLYGETLPVPSDRIRAVEGGDAISLGDRRLEVLYTPGHASHHIALRDSASGSIFTGEAIGSHLPWADCYRPALPPPEVDVEAALRSVELIRAEASGPLLTSHFGAVSDPDEACERASQRITEWTDTARDVLVDGRSQVGEPPDQAEEADHVADAFRILAAQEFLADSGGGTIDMARYNLIGSIEMNAAGLSRYWRKRWEAEEASS
jgi:glyoxylase-like metal-dependent hydrolase (beta-lactamase superfamily II)